jgi:UDP-N-acetylglucosamine 1-carboxyvinyltransferase
MGAQIEVRYNKATVTGVDALFGTAVIASDIRASCALVLAGLIAHGTTSMTGIAHFKRGYDQLDKKLAAVGARISLVDYQDIVMQQHGTQRGKQLKNV